MMLFHNLTLDEVDKLKTVYEMYEEYRKKWNLVPEDYEVVMFGFFRRLF
jgi:hypothetical protein